MMNDGAGPHERRPACARSAVAAALMERADLYFSRMFVSVAALALAGVSLASASFPAAAQTQYRILVGYPPGGVQDQEARIFADKLREATGRPFVVETRTGAAGQLAAEALLLAAPDGAPLLMTADSNISVYPHTVKKAAYSPLIDFVPIAHTGDYRIALAVGTAVPANDLRAFINWTQAQPGPSGYGTAGAGTNLHFYGVLLGQTTGARMSHVAYRGTGPAIIDLVAGHIPAAVLPLGSLLPHVKAGKIRVLGQTGIIVRRASPMSFVQRAGISGTFLLWLVRAVCPCRHASGHPRPIQRDRGAGASDPGTQRAHAGVRTGYPRAVPSTIPGNGEG
jgi:tripartite-type tricarboxylate transporter receptor subunit TctC